VQPEHRTPGSTKLVDYFHTTLKAGGDRNKIKGRKLFYQHVNRLLPAVDFGEHFIASLSMPGRAHG
jgi:hypothetical protein